MLLDGQEDMEVLGEGCTGSEAIKLAEAANLYIVLIEISLTDESGISVAHEIIARHPQVTRVRTVPTHLPRVHALAKDDSLLVREVTQPNHCSA